MAKEIYSYLVYPFRMHKSDFYKSQCIRILYKSLDLVLMFRLWRSQLLLRRDKAPIVVMRDRCCSLIGVFVDDGDCWLPGAHVIVAQREIGVSVSTMERRLVRPHLYQQRLVGDDGGQNETWNKKGRIRPMA